MWMELTEPQEMERFARHSGQQGQLASPALHIKDGGGLQRKNETWSEETRVSCLATGARRPRVEPSRQRY